MGTGIGEKGIPKRRRMREGGGGQRGHRKKEGWGTRYTGDTKGRRMGDGKVVDN
jgi:hypothetical protein